jgi:cell filamentation protein
MGQAKAAMAAKAGEVMGYLAYGHPFLDGNGRTIGRQAAKPPA